MKPEIHMPTAMQDLTVEVAVTGVKRARFRTWLGCKILILAGAVIGCQIEVDIRP